ncbi:hypothetical protein CLV24_101398 [Pontibacter ummariensis]|uniref:Deoxyribose-phosphate aldolase n=1 Tax=Pontibacter ummariensis TaxID=1610492 RepID=A0A239BGH9_9BACT|nr:DUF6503 family protein [Pontibacter ummariensis]PRY16551.1 hypothetical protein CLV24_101398 [Pontibacter ummariensis]SNS07175.1 hypothetical protein SAMN06296052_101398 [Pontibacter ummariensis]
MKLVKHTCNCLIVALFLLVMGCSETEDTKAQEVVDAALAAHGGSQLDEGVVSFKLRDKRYRALRDKGAYLYSRTFTNDSTGEFVHDVLRNSGFERTVDNEPVSLSAEKEKAYAASVNSVIYFALLPYFLNDPAVQKEYLGEATVKGEPYHKVRVTFAKEGGGEDYEDEYVYWFHQQRHTMDYLAYSFVEDGGGTRFREAVNPREVGGVRFQDYVNYTTKEDFPLQNYDRAFEAGKLEKVSDIVLEEVKVGELPQM